MLIQHEEHTEIIRLKNEFQFREYIYEDILHPFVLI